MSRVWNLERAIKESMIGRQNRVRQTSKADGQSVVVTTTSFTSDTAASQRLDSTVDARARALHLLSMIGTRRSLLSLSILISSLVVGIVLASRSVRVETLSKHSHGSGRSSMNRTIACLKDSL